MCSRPQCYVPKLKKVGIAHSEELNGSDIHTHIPTNMSPKICFFRFTHKTFMKSYELNCVSFIVFG